MCILKNILFQFLKFLVTAIANLCHFYVNEIISSYKDIYYQHRFFLKMTQAVHQPETLDSGAREKKLIEVRSALLEPNLRNIQAV